MANEAVKIVLLGNAGDVVRYNIPDAISLSAGTLCRMRDLLELSGSATTDTGVAFAGITSVEKVAGDGQTSLGVYTNGIFDLTMATNAAGGVGTIVCLSGANLIRSATSDEVLSGAAIGKLMETASSTEVVAVKVAC